MSKKRFVMLRRIHGRIHVFFQNVNRTYKTKKEANRLISTIKNLDEDVFVLAYTPSHGNLGDHAIALAEEKMLERGGIRYFELIDQQLNVLNNSNKLSVLDGHKLLIHGGGYLGTLWPHEEIMIRQIISSCPKSKILLFPNTIFYDKNNKLTFDDSIKIYNAHPNLTICTREKISYDLAETHYNNVMLVPDMVFSLDQVVRNTNRSGCLICLRNDKERTMTEDKRTEILKISNKLFNNNILYTDMVVNYRILPEQREMELNRKLDQFLKSELVITDRLHGMVFAARTGTPCIILNSKSPKIKGCYEWIKSLEYIRFVDNPDKIEDIYNGFAGKTYKYDNSHLKKHFESLIDFVEKMKRSE